MDPSDVANLTCAPVELPPVGANDSAELNVRGLRRFRALLVAGSTAAAAAVIGLVGPTVGYLVLDPLTRHVGALVTVSLAFFLAAAIVMPLGPGWRQAIRALVVAGLILALNLVLLLTVLTALEGGSRFESPDGRSIVVVTDGFDLIDPLWYVTVQQSSPVLAKTWNLACFSGDNPADGLASIRWVSSTVVEAQTDSGRTFRFAIDPSDSQPSTTISVGCDD